MIADCWTIQYLLITMRNVQLERSLSYFRIRVRRKTRRRYYEASDIKIFSTTFHIMSGIMYFQCFDFGSCCVRKLVDKNSDDNHFLLVLFCCKQS